VCIGDVENRDVWRFRTKVAKGEGKEKIIIQSQNIDNY
jgi:hypothetical protein